MSAPVRRIRTDTRSGRGGLARPVRDTGVSVRSSRTQSKRSPYPLMTLIALVVGLSFIGWMLSWDGADAGTEPTAASAPDAVTMEPERDPTPCFAEEGSTRLHLAVDPTQLTALAFHQASGEAALPLTSLVPDADMALANELKAVPPLDPNTEATDASVWNGLCLRLWRSNRTGLPDTAVDAGATPGTPVWSPVTGEVVQVRPYLLYDKYEDFEIHIRPEGRDDIDVVLIHVQDVKVEAGDTVKGGVTRLASVRQMSDKIDIQLAGYTANGGDHVHVQLNSVVVPGELGPAGGS